MNAASIVAIQAAVHDDLVRGLVIDVDTYCREFVTTYPDLTLKQIQDAILEIVSIEGGGALWGTERSPKR